MTSGEQAGNSGADGVPMAGNHGIDDAPFCHEPAAATSPNCRIYDGDLPATATPRPFTPCATSGRVFERLHCIAVPIDMLQLHGHETPDRVLAVKARYGLPVMKAVGVADASDLVKLDTYLKVADQILVDAKPPKEADLPGGNGLAFDWRLIAGRRWPIPWMLAGGLSPQNVAEAIAMTGAGQVDVSSGVESAPGVKDAARIAAFVAAAQA